VQSLIKHDELNIWIKYFAALIIEYQQIPCCSLGRYNDTL